MAPRTRSSLLSLAAGALLCGTALWSVPTVDRAFVGWRGALGGNSRKALPPVAASLSQLDADLDMLVDMKMLDVHTGSASPDFVSFRQNFAETPETLLNQQVQMELTASHAYMAMAAYFDRADVALPGFKSWAQKQSDEEREHAEKFIEYLNLRGGEYIPLNIAAPATMSWSSALDAMKSALRMEMEVNAALLKLHAAADEASDAQMCDFVESEYLTEQVESINHIAKVVRQLIRAGPGLGEYQVDQQIAA